MHLCGIAAMIYKRARICCEAAHGAADVLVDLCHLFVAFRHLSTGKCAISDPAISSPALPSCMGTCCSVCHIRVLTRSGEVMRFSTASTTPSFTFTPMAVEPSCGHSCGAYWLPISDWTRWYHAALSSMHQQNLP
jgi:hypothetical protein